jgi:hypothetical protein
LEWHTIIHIHTMFCGIDNIIQNIVTFMRAVSMGYRQSHKTLLWI